MGPLALRVTWVSGWQTSATEIAVVENARVENARIETATVLRPRRGEVAGEWPGYTLSRPMPSSSMMS